MRMPLTLLGAGTLALAASVTLPAQPFAAGSAPRGDDQDGAAVVRFMSAAEETFAFANATTERVLVLSYSDGFQCAQTSSFSPPLVQRVTTPLGEVHQLNLHSPMYARVYGPATIDDFVADPCGFIESTDARIAEGGIDSEGVHIHATDNEFLGPMFFVQGPGPGARTVHASWLGRLNDLINGGTVNLSLHIHVLFKPQELFGEFRFTGPTLTPDPLGLVANVR